MRASFQFLIFETDFSVVVVFLFWGEGLWLLLLLFWGGSWAGGWSLLVFSYENHCDCHKKLKIKKVVMISILLSKLDHRPLFSDIYFDAILW